MTLLKLIKIFNYILNNYASKASSYRPKFFNKIPLLDHASASLGSNWMTLLKLIKIFNYILNNYASKASSYLPKFFNKTPLLDHALVYLESNWMA